MNDSYLAKLAAAASRAEASKARPSAKDTLKGVSTDVPSMYPSLITEPLDGPTECVSTPDSIKRIENHINVPADEETVLTEGDRLTSPYSIGSFKTNLKNTMGLPNELVRHINYQYFLDDTDDADILGRILTDPNDDLDQMSTLSKYLYKSIAEAFTPDKLRYIMEIQMNEHAKPLMHRDFRGCTDVELPEVSLMLPIMVVNFARGSIYNFELILHTESQNVTIPPSPSDLESRCFDIKVGWGIRDKGFHQSLYPSVASNPGNCVYYRGCFSNFNHNLLRVQPKDSRSSTEYILNRINRDLREVIMTALRTESR